MLSAPDPAVASTPTVGPRPLEAGLLLLGYFGLQLALSLPLIPLLRWLHQRPGWPRWQPDLLLLWTCIDLLLSGLLLLWWTRHRWPQAWSSPAPGGIGFAPMPARAGWLAAVIGLLLIPVGGGLLTEALAHGKAITEQLDGLITDADRWAQLPILLVAIVLVPMVEETLFRGVLLSALLSRWSPRVAVLTVSAVFALAHLSALDYQWYALPSLAVFAAVLVWLRMHYRSIWPGVIAHGCNNLMALISILHGK